MPPLSLTKIEIQKYCPKQPKFIGFIQEIIYIR